MLEFLNKIKSFLGWAVAVVEGIIAATGNFPQF